MKIIENSREYLTDFIRLNEEWINQYFSIEETDKKLELLIHSKSSKMGAIFFI